MCLNPQRLLCVRGTYKGVVKTSILFKTSSLEYELGYATRLLSQLKPEQRHFCNKIGVVRDGLVSPFVLFNDRIELPCRKCLECTRNRAKEWSVRCQLEAMQYPSNYNFMVTLTYNDSSLPFRDCVFTNSEGELSSIKKPTLKIEDCQSFMKALRKPFERSGHKNIRFFSCGEYGSSTHRPHYHFILFNVPLNDLVYFKTSKTGFPLYRSETLEKSWKKGFVTVQPFSIECARYVAQYCVKKLSKSDLNFGVKPEFINMSRRPGIGMNWFYKNMDDKIRLINNMPNDHLFLPCRWNDGSVKSLKFKVPSAFTRIFKPVTDSKRGIDTEIPDIAFMLNLDEEMFIDALSELSEIHSEFADKALFADMSKYGFAPDDKYTSRYIEYLKRKESDILLKFKPCRKGV